MGNTSIATANLSTASAVTTPPAPAHLPAEAKQQWIDTYNKAFAQAQNDYPGNARAQRTAAQKAANALLAVTAPKSAADIDALPAWQVLLRSTRTVGDVQTRLCVTADGHKYSFPVESAPPDPPAKDTKKTTK